MVTKDYRMLQNRDCVIFDLDGTLADTSADLLAAANACFLSLGEPAPLGPDDSLTAFHGGRAMLKLGYERLGRAMDAAEIERLYPMLLEHYRQGIAVHTRPYPGAVAAVERLHTLGYRVAICTNKPEDLARLLLAELGIDHLFHALVGANTLPVRKPDPAPYLLALEQALGQGEAGRMLGRSILIGDTETDLKTARAVGVPVVLVSFGPEGQGIARLSPDALLDDYAHLPDLVARLLA